MLTMAERYHLSPSEPENEGSSWTDIAPAVSHVAPALVFLSWAPQCLTLLLRLLVVSCGDPVPDGVGPAVSYVAPALVEGLGSAVSYAAPVPVEEYIAPAVSYVAPALVEGLGSAVSYAAPVPVEE